ncbi:MAG: S-layer homology domain-containing protein [Clostridia bacterium]|nr:S-layer homology domain-containing protein [Clostridia bacterium]
MKKRISSFCLVVLLLVSTIVPTMVFANDGNSNKCETITPYGDYAENEQVSKTFNQQLTTSMSAFNVDNTMSLQNSDNDTVRDTVLVLDNSVSMAGTPMNVLKSSAIKFCESVLSADGTNRVSVVIYDTDITDYCNFTSSLTLLKSTINSMDAEGSWTNINAGLKKADVLLQRSSANIKNIVVMTDGVPTAGSHTSTGRYSYSDYYGTHNASYYCYEYANSLYNTATELKNIYSIYSLGFLHSMNSTTKSFASKVLQDIQNSGYYEVIDPDDLEFTFGNVADDITNTKLRGTFYYQSGAHDYSSTFYYDDDYFTDFSDIYNSSLATMSMCLAMSAFGSSDGGNDYTEKSKNASDLLTQCGFTNYSTNDYLIGGFDNENKPTTDSIGVVGASKKIEDDDEIYTLIAVAIRGSGYESEWTSNFTMGSTGQHQGFREAKENVLKFINKYINDYGIDGKVKIWVTGYSRAAATANLVGAALCDKSAKNYISSIGNGISYSATDIFTYCFETPSGGIISDNLYDSIYDSIFNIINPNDPVTKVAPSTFDFGRYGIDKIIPTEENDAYYSVKLQNMLKEFYSLSSTGSYTVDDFQMKKFVVTNILPGGKSPIQDDTRNNLSQSIFLDDFINRLMREFIWNRDNYVATYQEDIRYIASTFFGASDSQADQLIESVTNDFRDNWTDIVSPLFDTNPFKSSAEKEREAYNVIAGFIKDGLDNAGIAYNENEIDTAIQSIADLLVAYIVNHPNLTSTLIGNIDGIGSAHHPELCFAWLRSMDMNYNSGAGESFSSGNYRIIRINCPIDVTVTDSEGNIVASINDDMPQVIENSSIITAINEDGEKIVILPSNAEYDISLQATADGTMSYSINEYNPIANDTVRVTGFFDVEIENGDVLNSNIPEYSYKDLEGEAIDGSSAIYTLKDDNGKNIAADINITGEEAAEAYYMVQLQVNNDAYGTVLGQGIRLEGSFAQIEATPNANYTFVGWYEGTTLLSTEQTYRFRVEKDVTITAKFETATQNNPFNDVKESYWFYTSVMYCLNKGYVSGMTETTFVPNGKLTRAQFLTMLAKLDGVDLTAYDTVDAGFKDVKTSHWYNEVVCWAVEQGITSGLSETKFGPNNNVTRAQVARFFYVYSEKNGIDITGREDLSVFPDVSKVANWAKEPMEWAVAAGLISGTTKDNKTYLDPNGTATRAQATVMFKGFDNFRK